MGVFNDDLLFIHIPKTAGTSVKAWLWDHLPGAKGQKPGSEDGGHDTGGLPIGHIPLRDIERFTGRTPDSFDRIIAIIRNPYEQQLSQWRFWRERYAVGDRHPSDIAAASHPTMEAWLNDPMCDFHLWYEERFGSAEPWVRTNSGPENGYRDFGGYYLYWISVAGAVPDNVEVIRMEELGRRWPQVVAPFVGDDAPPLPHHNTGDSKRYPTLAYYTPQAAAMVQAKFRWAFEHHYQP